MTATEAEGYAVKGAPRRVLMAGASGGIGQQVFRLFSGDGAVIGAHYFQNGQELQKIAKEVSQTAPRIRLFQADLTNAQSARRLVDEFVQWAGGIDVLIQLTGGVRGIATWEQISECDWQNDLNLNLTAPFFLAQAAMKHMKASGGKILLTSTASARHGGGATSLAYGVAKAGIECLTKALAREGAAFGILVNAICPGFIETQFHTRWMHRSLEDLHRRMNLVPLKRSGTASEAAALFYFLASPLADYITGECICISGGDWL